MAFNYFENASNIGSAGFANGNTSTVVPAHQLGNLERAGPDGKLRGVDFVGSPSLTVSPSGNSAAVNGIQNLIRHQIYENHPVGQVVYTAPMVNINGGDTIYWTVPNNVYSICVVCVGGGGGGVGATSYGGGGGGGGLVWMNDIAVKPGHVMPFQVGSGGAKVQQPSTGTRATSGGDTWFVHPSFLRATGGQGGVRANTDNSNQTTGGIDVVNDGNAYSQTLSNVKLSRVSESSNITLWGTTGGGHGGRGATYNQGGGGGGAGGYTGDGGHAGRLIPTGSNNGSDGAGGGGGGGGRDNQSYHGAGGGVGLLGAGSNGTGGTGGNVASSGTGGSGGGDGGNPVTLAPVSNNAGGAFGGLYGGGGAGAERAASGGNADIAGDGGHGGIRIIWGPNRAFPSTNTGDL